MIPVSPVSCRGGRPAASSRGLAWTLAITSLVAVAPLAAQSPNGDPRGVVEEGSPETETAGTPLRVVVAGSEPFVGPGTPPTRGIAIELWDEMAKRLEVTYEVRTVPSADDAIAAVADGEADVAVGPLSITSDRAGIVAFTQPWHDGALAIAARSEVESLWQRMRPFATRTFLGGVASLIAVLVVVGLLFWLTERKANPDQFPSRPHAGIANGMWLALVTMTTVGYGDRAPVTPAGRLVASVWMVIAMLTASSLTAFLATALTLSQIDTGEVRTVRDLVDRKVAAPTGTTAVAFVRRRGGRVVEVPDVDEGLERLVAGEVDALVFDRPVLRWHLSRDPHLEVALSPAVFERVGYGFAVRHGDPLRRRINVGLLDLAETGVIDGITTAWLGHGEDP